MPTNLVNGRIPANQIDPNGQALLSLLPRPNADPALTGGYNYVDSLELDQNMQQWLSRVDVNVSDNTRMFVRYNLQPETQNFPVGLWWRNANQVPYPTAITAPNRSHSVTDEPDSRLRPVADDRDDVRRDLHRLPEPVRRSEPGLALGARLHQPGRLRQRPRPDPVDDRLGQRADDVQPGRVRPRAVREEVADLRRAERDQGRGRAHDEGRRLLRVGQQQPAGQRRLERPPDSGLVGRQHHRQLLRGHPHRQPRRVRRAVAERRPRHGLQHLRGLHPGQLEGVATG